MNKFEIFRSKAKDMELISDNYNLVYSSFAKSSLTIDSILFQLTMNLPPELNNKPLTKGDVIVHYINEQPTAYYIDVNTSAVKLDNFLNINNQKHSYKSNYKENLNKVNMFYSAAINDLKSNFNDNILKTLKAFSKFYNYSFKNCILINEQKPDAKYLLSFNDWDTIHNAKIKKGEKAIHLFIYAEKKVITTEPVYKDGEVLVDNQGNPVVETTENKKGGYSFCSLFDISQVTTDFHYNDIFKSIDNDIIASAVENVNGDNSITQAIHSGKSDLKHITADMINSFVDLKYKPINPKQQAINACVKFVVLNALNLPCKENLVYECRNTLITDVEANLKQIKLNSRFILKGIENSLLLNNLQMFDYNTIDKNTDFNQAQIKTIQNAVEKGLSSDNIVVFAQPYYDAENMRAAIEAFEAGLNRQQVNSIMSYSPMQMREIIKTLKNPKATAYHKVFIKNKSFSYKEMEQINRAVDLRAEPEKMQILIKNKFDWTQMFEIVNGFEDNLSVEQLQIIANDRLNSAQMFQVRRGFNEGLSADDVKSYIRPELDNFEMARQIDVIKALKEKGVKKIEVNSLDYLVEDAKRVMNDQKKAQQAQQLN